MNREHAIDSMSTPLRLDRHLTSFLSEYADLLAEIDRWFARCQTSQPEHIHCASGCSGCCRGLFDITLLDAALLQQGFALLPDEIRRTVLQKSQQRRDHLQSIWPEFAPPFVLNYRTEEDWEALMPDDDETPCVLLDANGRCLVYNHRPMTCRLHGLPLIDICGEVMHDEWCTDNFKETDPLALPDLAAPFTDMFRREVSLGRVFSRHWLGEVVHELDTFIPLALLMDYRDFHWPSWWRENRTAILTLAESGTNQE
jgi:Fe-S-cluster containining protein